MDYKTVYANWTNDEYFDEETRNELLSIANDDQEIKERFHKNLDFGTGGLRGIIGAGTNRMNKYTVRKATQGLANFILSSGGDSAQRGVAIAYDSRRFSKEFALSTALVLCGNGIKTYIFEDLRPTPELSFAVRHLNCVAGIVVTASHNPPEYNGYKVYWDDGGQVVPPMDAAIVDEVAAIRDYSAIKVMDHESAVAKGLLVTIGKEVDDAFMKEVMSQSLGGGTRDFVVVYTPLNGAGNTLVRRALRLAGFTVHVPKEQEEPDPDFTTVGYPNPESPAAFDLAMELLAEKKADIALATDPDCDRVGVCIRKNGQTIHFSGNVIGVLLVDFVLTAMAGRGRLPQNAAVISTIVSSDMTRALCSAYGAAYYEVLTGFKYIGQLMNEFEDSGRHATIMAFEESIGYQIGRFTRDKDAVTSSLLICEMASYYKSRGMDLDDAIHALYEKYGCYKETTINLAMPGIDGLAKTKGLMSGLRQNPPLVVGDVPIIERRDYKIGQTINSGGIFPTGLPTSDVLYYVLSDASWFCVRPSGTEPKVKVYMGVQAKSPPEADAALKTLEKWVVDIVKVKD